MLTEAQAGVAVLLAISVVVAVLVHCFDHRIVRAILVSATIATILFQGFAYVHAGHLDPFFLIALFVGGGIAALVATVIGLAFLAYRRLRSGAR